LRNPDLRFLLASPAHFFALGCGAGLIPRAPGTAGTLVGLPLFALLALLPVWLFWMVLALFFVAGIAWCDAAGRALGVPDHGAIVWDEIVAFVLVLAFTPAAPLWYVVAFVLFRLFDIWKPFPIRYFDRSVKGGFGVMLDDLLAAIYTIIVLLLARRVVPF
jgi:phosphatidylglycerophosphatase A